MSTAELLEELTRLTNAERLAVIEAATKLIRQDLLPPTSARQAQDRRLEAAARDARDLYEPGEELTEWTSLDVEDFVDENIPR